MFYKEEKNKLIFNDDGECIYFVPENYFETNIAEVFGDTISLLGIFDYAVYDKNGKIIKQGLFKLPTVFECKPSSVTKETLTLKGYDAETKYRALHFIRGDELMCSLDLVMSVDNAEKFTTMLMRSKLPESIPYDELQNLIQANADMNDLNYKISPQLYGILISVLCRDPKDMTRSFRLSGDKNMTNYKSISILKVPKYVSPYTAITSENADESIAAAMTVKPTASSPLEKAMMN